MTETMLSVEESLELEQREGRIQGAFWDIVAELRGIETQRLSRAKYPTFSDYLNGRWPTLCQAESTWRQWRASHDAYIIAIGEGAVLANEHAARALRKVEQAARALVVRKAAQYAGTTELRAADITPVAKIVADVLREAANTGGYVDTGDGSMTALEAAVDLALQERLERKRQHIADSVTGNGWSAPIEFYWSGDWRGDMDNIPIPPDLAALPAGTKIEWRYRVLTQEKVT